MRSALQTRIELLGALSQLSQLRPEWRLGQTLANLATTAGRLDAGGVWDLEDDEALSAARTLIAQYAEIASRVAESGAEPEGVHQADPASLDSAVGGPRT
jgi:hypothetical protein